MVARILGILMLAGAMSAPAFAGEVMKAHEARDFVAGKLFAFNCFDGTRGAGRIFSDGSAAGSIQFGGSGPTRFVRLPSNTLQVRGENVCAKIKGMPFDPCFNLDKTSDNSFRGAVSGMGFAYCEFSRKSYARAELGGSNARARVIRRKITTASAESTPAAAPTTPVAQAPLELRKSAD
jgi:hypothetical protein